MFISPAVITGIKY